MTDNDIIRGIRENSSEAWRELYHSAVEGIREKIEPDPQHPRYIETVWGAGYRFRA